MEKRRGDQTTSINSSPNTKTSLTDDKALLSIIKQNNTAGGNKCIHQPTEKEKRLQSKIIPEQPGRNTRPMSEMMGKMHQLREKLKSITAMIPNSERQSDAKIRRFHGNQSPPCNNISHGRTTTGLQWCFSCNTNGHLSSNCPEC